MKPFNGRRVVLGVTGSIAAFKAAALTSELVQLGAEVDVVLTASAARFVTPLTFHSLTQRRVYTDLFDVLPDESSAHVRLGEQAELLAIVPATATTLARLAHGLADDLLGCVALATTAPVLVAPAMESHMWAHPATQANVTTLRERGVHFVGPVARALGLGADRAGEGWRRRRRFSAGCGRSWAATGRWPAGASSSAPAARRSLLTRCG